MADDEALAETIGQQEVDLLREIAGKLDSIKSDLETGQTNWAECCTTIVGALQAIQQTETTIASLLATFLQDFIEDNTPTPGPAVSVRLTWGPPQPIP